MSILNKISFSQSIILELNLPKLIYAHSLVRLVLSLVTRMAENLGTKSIAPILDYVMNNAHVWDFPEVQGESIEDRDDQNSLWRDHLVSLDTALLSLLGEQEIAIAEIPEALDAILQSSLWQRRLNRHKDDIKLLFNSVLAQRGRHIWNATTTLQRKGYFLAGVGLTTGQLLDSISAQANVLLINANAYISANNQESAITTIIKLAELVFEIPPFAPRNLPDDWKVILTAWLNGESLTDGIAINIDDALQFIEDGLIYRLPWGLEALRVRAEANLDVITNETTINDYELGLVVPAIENGTLNRSAALLMQAGFNSRKAAIHAVLSTNASFITGRQLKAWLGSEEVLDRTLSLIWPTPETSTLWWAFLDGFQPMTETTWKPTNAHIPVDWIFDQIPLAGTIVKLWNGEKGNTQVLASDCERVGNLFYRYDLLKTGVYHSKVNEAADFIDVTYWGAEKDGAFEIITSLA